MSPTTPMVRAGFHYDRGRRLLPLDEQLDLAFEFRDGTIQFCKLGDELRPRALGPLFPSPFGLRYG